jgi:type II secretory pathway component GspD/PulD (secretin)
MRIKTFIRLQNIYCFGFWFTILFLVLIFYDIAQTKSEFSELISLNTNNEPLAEVLDNVSQATGYEFIIDESWDDLPITVKFDAIPLDQALKRILAKVNHAIVYNSDRKVLIRIYEEESNLSGQNGASRLNRNPQEPDYHSPQLETSTSPNPVPTESFNEEPESEDSELVSDQPETPEKGSENEEGAEGSDETSAAEEKNEP